KSAAEMGHLTIKILNIEGRLLSTEDLEFEKQASLDVSGLSKGIYLLSIENENGLATVKKFIKE
ncbi:MAG: T9SS type A sorting domain-containing protein, partial [Aequorivita sp.]